MIWHPLIYRHRSNDRPRASTRLPPQPRWFGSGRQPRGPFQRLLVLPHPTIVRLTAVGDGFIYTFVFQVPLWLSVELRFRAVALSRIIVNEAGVQTPCGPSRGFPRATSDFTN